MPQRSESKEWFAFTFVNYWLPNCIRSAIDGGINVARGRHRVTQVKTMKPHEVFKSIFYKWMASCGATFGHNIFDKKFTISLHTVCVVIVILSIGVFSVYTALTYELEIALKSCSLFSLAMQGIVKSTTVLVKRDDINSAVTLLGCIYEQNEKSTVAYVRILDQYARNVIRTTKALGVLYCMCGIMFVSWPLISLVMFGAMEPAVPIFLPALDVETRVGFGVNWMYHAYILGLATAGFIFCDAMYVDLVLHVKMMSALIAKHWDCIREQLVSANGTVRVRVVKGLFRNVCQMHQEMTT